MARWLICLVAGLLFTCADRTFDNPFDNKVSKDAWAPQDFQLEITGNNSVRLTWTQPDERIDGYLLTKKINGTYEELNLDPTDRSYEDDVANPDLQKRLKVEYFIKAKATTNFSDQVKTETESELPFLPPSVELIDVALKSRAEFEATAEVNSDGGKNITSFGFCWNKTGNPTINDTKIVSNGDYKSYISQLSDLIYLDQYYVRAFAINDVGVSYSNQIVKRLINPYLNQSLTYEKLTDINGNSYAAILIGSQTWMAENLAVVNFNNNDEVPNVTKNDWASQTIGAYCDYDNEPANSLWYGRLYNHFAAVDSRSLCPSGWHLPSSAEWNELTAFVSTSSELVSSQEGWPNGYSNSNSTGFSAVPAGLIINSNGFGNRGSETYLWGSEIIGSSATVTWIINRIGSQGDLRYYGHSVRCVKN